MQAVNRRLRVEIYTGVTDKLFRKVPSAHKLDKLTALRQQLEVYGPVKRADHSMITTQAIAHVHQSGRGRMSSNLTAKGDQRKTHIWFRADCRGKRGELTLFSTNDLARVIVYMTDVSPEPATKSSRHVVFVSMDLPLDLPSVERDRLANILEASVKQIVFFDKRP